MKRQALVLTAALTACAPSAYIEGPLSEAPSADEPSVGAPAASYEEARQQVAADLATLESLELFEVWQMVDVGGMSPGSCYGPCDDDAEQEQRYIEQAARLRAFTDLADDDPEGLGPCYVTALDVVEESLDAIEALDVVQVGAFIETAAAPNPSCYNMPCPEDERAAAADNEARAQVIWHLAERSEGL